MLVLCENKAFFYRAVMAEDYEEFM